MENPDFLFKLPIVHQKKIKELSKVKYFLSYCTTDKNEMPLLLSSQDSMGIITILVAETYRDEIVLQNDLSVLSRLFNVAPTKFF